MLNFIRGFAAEDDGAVTVDWVVLTAFIVVLGLFVGNIITIAVRDLAIAVAADISTSGD